MSWKKLTFIIFRNALLGVAVATLALGGIGFLVAGPEGLLNGAIWGAVFGLGFAPISVALMVIEKLGGRRGENFAYFRFREENNPQGDPNAEDLDTGWQIK